MQSSKWEPGPFRHSVFAGCLEEAPVNNTLSDAFQEPAVSNMSVAIVTLLACAQHPRAGCSRLYAFISASSQAGCPMGCQVLPAGLAAGTVAAERREPHEKLPCGVKPGVHLGAEAPNTPHLLQLPFHRAGEWMWSSSFHVAFQPLRVGVITIFPHNSLLANLGPVPLQQRAP